MAVSSCQKGSLFDRKILVIALWRGSPHQNGEVRYQNFAWIQVKMICKPQIIAKYSKQEVGKIWKIICAKQVMSALPMSSKMGLESVNTCGMKTWNTARIHRLRTHLWRHQQRRHHLLRTYDLSSLANFLFILDFYLHWISKES